MSASGKRNTSGNLSGEALANAFSTAATRLLSDAELSFAEFVSIFDVMIMNVSARRTSTAVASKLAEDLPSEPDLPFPMPRLDLP